MSAFEDIRRSVVLTCTIGLILCASALHAAEQTPQADPPSEQPNEQAPAPPVDPPTEVPPPERPNEDAPTPSEVPSDRPISELDESEKPPPAPEQREQDSAEEAVKQKGRRERGPPIPEGEAPGPITACKEIKPEHDTMLERVRRTLAVTACASSAWLDGLFGDQFHYDAYLNTRGSLSVGALWSEYDGLDPRLRARVRLQLPQWDERISAFAGRVGEEDYVSDTEGEFTALPTRQFAGGLEDESVLVGLGYSSPDRTGNDFDAGVGVRIDLPLDPYARARYEIVRTFAEHYVFRARETVFWQNSEGFGSTTRFNIDRALSERFLLRWSNLAKYTEETEGVEWSSEVTLFQRLNQRMGIAWQNYISGTSDAEVDLQRYGARAILRRQLTPSWLFLEVRAGFGWPREKIFEERKLSFEGGIAFEMQFADERL
jgi:hypothetical protein